MEIEILAHRSILISDSTHPGEVRRAAARIAETLKFGEVRAGELSIVVMEIAQNVFTHAKSGEVLLLGWKAGSCSGIDILALDKGPGIGDLQRSLRDGYSTAGTPGNGFGAISRLSSDSDVYSSRGQGTVLWARLVEKKSTESLKWPDIAGLVVPFPGETVSGDGMSISCEGSRRLCIVVDGLGHGIGAAEATATAMQIFQENSEKSPEWIMTSLHLAMRATRGAAVAIAEVDFTSHTLRYCGVGNICGSIINDTKPQSLVSQNGTVGHVMSNVREFVYQFPAGSLLVMHSDGVSTQWNLAKYPGLRQRHPGLVSGILYRDFKRVRDDASVLAMREGPERTAE